MWHYFILLSLIGGPFNIHDICGHELLRTKGFPRPGQPNYALIIPVEERECGPKGKWHSGYRVTFTVIDEKYTDIEDPSFPKE